MIHASSTLQDRIAALPIDPEFERRYRVLLELCRRNLPYLDEKILRHAFEFGHWAHRNDSRASGEPYFFHPIEVACIVAREISVDNVSIVAALLHDVVEDTPVTLDMIRAEFNEETRNLIDGLTKIEGVLESREIKQAENSRKLILSMASDVRVILIKFADRLHNMRTLKGLPQQKQWRIATETLDFFVPLAHRFGLFNIKSQLEDLSLKVLDQEKFKEITNGLDQKKAQRDRYIERFIQPIKAKLTEKHFQFDIKGRPKSIFSIYNKMKKQGKELDEIYDLFAIRITLQSIGEEGKADCWRVYSVLTDEYTPLPDRFRDFISNPKSNGYQSIHTTLLGPEGRKVEVQIRTREMDEIAERGLAAHWKYKEDAKYHKNRLTDTKNTEQGRRNRNNALIFEDQWYTWVRDMLETPSETATEFVKDFRLNLYEEEIQVFTPKGDMFTLPKDATPIDFAFHVHTEVGFHCIGAKVNHKIVPLSTKLKTADQIEIITSKKQTPNADWIKFVQTTKAKTRVKQYINEKRRKAIELGREVLEKKLNKLKIELTNQQLDRHSKSIGFTHISELYLSLGVNDIELDHVIKQIQKGIVQDEREQKNNEDKQRQHYENFVETAQEHGKSVLRIGGEVHNNMKIIYASCCNPIPGDEVFGLISLGNGMRIHRTSCKNAPEMFKNQSERIMDVEWGINQGTTFLVNLRVIGTDRVGMFNDISNVISKTLKINIRSIQVSAEEGFFDGRIVLDISDVNHLARLKHRLSQVEGVHEIHRFEG